MIRSFPRDRHRRGDGSPSGISLRLRSFAARDDDQLLAISRSRTCEVAVFGFDRESAKLQEVTQLPAIGPAEAHLARILGKHLSAGADFRVAPEILTDLSKMVEADPQDFADVLVLRDGIDTGKSRR